MTVHLLNDTLAPRVKSSDGCTVQPCGCASTDTRWLQLCETHWLEEKHYRDAARITHAARIKP